MHGTLVAAGGRQRPDAIARSRPDPESQAIIPVQSSGPSRYGSSQRGTAPDPEQWIDQWERRMAAAAVKDLENCGADQDLEALRAGWSSSERPGWHSGVSASRLNQRGDVAARRLSTVNNLRNIAEGKASPGEVSESSVPNALCLANAPSSRAPPQRRIKTESSKQQNMSSTNRQPVGRRPSPHRDSSPLKAMLEEDDPWSAWERKWADAFEQMGANTRRSTDLPPSGVTTDSEQKGGKDDAQDDKQHKAQHGSTRTRPGGYPGRTPQNNNHSSARPPPRTGAYRAGSPSSAGSSRVPPGGSSRSGKGPPPRPTQSERRPPAPEPRPLHRFANFTVYEEAWSRFEKAGAMGAVEISLQDIPWPLDLPTVSGVDRSDSSGDCKRKLRAALLRWHPDKWGPILDRIRESDKNEVTERVKEVTRRILEEKAQHS